jgi:serine/threonine-protein kinase
MSAANKFHVALGATAIAGLAALVGVGAVPADAYPARVSLTEVATTTRTSVRPSGDPNKVLSILPKGYSSSNCSAVTPPAKDAVATVDCQANTISSAMEVARFNLYPDQATLDRHFKSGAAGDVVSLCPGDVNSPGDWHYESTPNEVAGQVVCGTYKGKADLMWSQSAELMLGDIQGSDLNALYQWWAKHS